ncbi:MAG: amidohydrolase family protein [Gordonia sp. (in: high G+C Gram-positive bacteria)]
MTEEWVGPSAITGALVMDAGGSFGYRGTVTIDGGRFAGFADDVVPESNSFDARGCWVIPGVYDCHTHLTWSDFHSHDRERHSAAEAAAHTAAALTATLRAGVTSARDAGGATAELAGAIAANTLAGPRLQVSVNMIGPEVAGSVSGVSDAVRAALDSGAQWIKLLATGGVATAGDAVLASYFTTREIEAAIGVAAARGVRVMVHSWGGDSLDAAIGAGAASIEHGIHLTPDQARRAAAAGTTFVPTLTVYRQVQQMVHAGELPGVAPERIDAAVAVHQRAVLHARDAGLAIALGSDFGTARQHGTNLIEIASLIRAGLTGPEALIAATRSGALLLGDGGSGRIAAGDRADAVILDADPHDPHTYESGAHVRAVLKDGRFVYRAG